jgi:hypothetical protein
MIYKNIMKKNRDDTDLKGGYTMTEVATLLEVDRGAVDIGVRD